jgi:hypothetical protein
MKRLAIYFGIGSLAALICVILFINILFNTHFIPCAPGNMELSRLEVEGGNIVSQIEAYQQANGNYPVDLAAVGIVVPDESYGGWHYSLNAGNREFCLSIGKYSENAFVLKYDSKHKEWYRDT